MGNLEFTRAIIKHSINIIIILIVLGLIGSVIIKQQPFIYFILSTDLAFFIFCKLKIRIWEKQSKQKL